MSASSPLQTQIDELLSGPALGEWLRQMFPGDDGRAEATLAGLFWSKWQRQSAMHPNYLAALEPLSRALMALPAAQWVGAEQHPLWRLLELLQSSGAGYQPELGRAGEKLINDLQALWPALEAGDWAGALAAAEAQWQQDQSRLQRLEQRLIDAERGQIENRRAQQQAARVINRALAGKRLSDAMLIYMHDVWYAELQWCFLQFGEASTEWQRRLDLTTRLVDSLQDPGDDVEHRQRLYALIPELSAELRETLIAHAPEQSILNEQLAMIEMHHVAILKGRPLPAEPCALIENNDPWADSNTTLSRDLLQKAATLEPGMWFLLHGDSSDGGATRIKLALKMEDTAQLLFVNRVGVRALQKSFEEFAYMLAIDVVAPMPTPNHARALLRQLFAQLMQREAERQRARVEEAKRLAAEQLRVIKEELHRRAAREKAMAEAAALAAAQERAAAQEKLEAEQRAREQEQLRRRTVQEEQAGDADQRARSARQNATLIAIGSWVELHDEVGDVQRLKLAVKLPSSGKLIFVDREGIRRAEFERDAFAARLLDGSARVLNAGPQFEDTLARVVGSLRRDTPRD
ncbi:MAG: DUF1631 family protein [Spongiibacteraceae bacterium]